MPRVGHAFYKNGWPVALNTKRHQYVQLPEHASRVADVLDFPCSEEALPVALKLSGTETEEHREGEQWQEAKRSVPSSTHEALRTCLCGKCEAMM